VKRKLESLKAGLPAGVEIVPTYDRSELIERAVSNLEEKLVEEFIVVALVCFAFLFHLRSALVAVVALPLGVLAAFGVMHSRASTRTSCRSAGLRSPSAPWSMPRS
jgi:Cu(I)/Ag(I) efflux system membrane protein CusA/SilA